MPSSVRRPTPWIVAAVVVVAGCLALAISAFTGNAGTVAPLVESAPTVQSSSPFIFGIDYADELPAASNAELGRGLADAGTVGAGWIRVDLAWYRVEPAPGVWNWSAFDRTEAQAQHDGLRILAILDQAPSWARKASCAAQLWCPPADDNAFATFAAKAAQRYPTSVVGGWEIWNEENLSSYWAGGPDPAGYTALLAAASTAIRAAQPQAEIALGGLALAENDGVTLSPKKFLTGVAQRGGLKDVSAVGYHPYTFPTMPAKAAAFGDIGTGSGSLASILNHYGAADMPIWITEAGAAVTGAAADPTGAQVATRIAEQEQADYVTDLVKTATANPHVRALFWFSDIDLPDQSLYYGLRRANGTDRPALTAFKDAITAFNGS
jgi:hypothetical protein